MNTFQHPSLSMLARSKMRWAIAVFYFLSGVNFASFTSRIPELQLHLNLSNAALGTILVALPIGLFASMPFVSWAVNVYGTKKILWINGVIYTIMLYFLSWVNHPWSLFLVLFLFGAARTFFNVSINALSVELQRHYDRSIVNSFHGVWSAAALIGAGFSFLLISKNISMHMHYAGVTLLSFGLIFFFIRWMIPMQQPTTTVGKRFKLPDGPFLLLGLMAFCVMFCEGTMNDWSGVYMDQIARVTGPLITSGYVAYLLAMLTGRFLGDWLVQKLGMVRLISICGGLTFVGFLGVMLSSSYLFILTGFLIIGFGVSCVVPMIFVMTSKVSTLQAGSVISMVSSVGYLGFLSGPPLIGYLSQLTNLRYAFSLCLLCAIGILLLLKNFIRTAPKTTF